MQRPQFPVNPTGDPQDPNAPVPDGEQEKQEPAEQGAPHGGTGNEPTDEDGVPIVNRYHEFRRKFGRSQEQLTALREENRRLKEQAHAGRPTPPVSGGGQPSIQQGIGQLTEAQKREMFNGPYGYNLTMAELERSQQEAEARAERRWAQKQQEQEAAMRALQRYPDLADPSSEMYEATNDYLTTLVERYESQGLPVPPDAVLHAANEAAMSGVARSKSDRATASDPSWGAMERARAADRGAPPPPNSADRSAGVDLPTPLKSLNARSRSLGATAAEREQNLAAFIERDPISQAALQRLQEGR